MLLERSFIAIEQGNFRILNQEFQISGGQGVSFKEFQNSLLCHPLARLGISNNRNSKIPSLRGSKAEGVISRNSSFYFRNSSFLGVRGFLLRKIQNSLKNVNIAREFQIFTGFQGRQPLRVQGAALIKFASQARFIQPKSEQKSRIPKNKFRILRMNL